ncbi:transposase [Rhodococcus erythropolis]|uniref:transposase n=1 Tax=Rhodococcus erythropolis TaxID=1833 RepID=UPI003673063B
MTGFGFAVEISDWRRFTGNTIGPYVGLVSSKYSSGTSRSQGSIAETRNGHACRLLAEAAWHHRKIYCNPGQVMRTRWEKASPAARDRGHTAITDSARNDLQNTFGQQQDSKAEPFVTPDPRAAAPFLPNSRPAVANPRISV